MKGFFAIANLLFTFGDCHDWAKLSILCAYYRSAVGVLIVYDITKRTTYDHVKLWLQEVQAHTAEDTVVMLVGNKCDLRHLRAVSTEEARKLAAENGMSFIETSALDATNVSQAINQIMFDIHQKHGALELGFDVLSKSDVLDHRTLHQQPTKTTCCS
eukprot:m.264259 g.264259  ORF g.264259 m.264259 type:complete len:158 (+) comp54656_c0_seq18:3-476(+)